MLKPTSLVVTADDYRALPPGGPRYQVVDGELHMSPSPTRYHQRIVMNIAHLLQGYLDDHPIGEVYVAPLDVYLTEINVFQPDVIYVTKENAAVLTDEGLDGAPDLVVEILSPSNARLDTGPKREVYARTGVKELWVVNPDRKQLQLFRLRENA